VTLRRTLFTVISSLALIGAGLAVATPASASPASVCGPVLEFGNMCYFWASDYQGSQGGLSWPEDDLNPWTFVTAGSGAGERIGNNSGSGHNRDSKCRVTIYANRTWTGANLTLTENNSNRTLGVVNNDNESQLWHTC
jgi:hypothetical protein